jgi:hypothetical protein
MFLSKAEVRPLSGMCQERTFPSSFAFRNAPIGKLAFARREKPDWIGAELSRPNLMTDEIEAGAPSSR